jgi:TonB family protein
MFRDKSFNISLLISLFWHVVWLSVVSIVAVPTGLHMAKYTDVYFLGPVLEKTAFELMAGESPIRTETLYMRPVLPHYTFEVEIEPPMQHYASPALESGSSSMYHVSLADILRESKATVPYFFKETSFIATYTEVDSPLEGRMVLFKPEELPRIPLWVTQERQRFKIELEFTVSPAGTVKEVKPIVSSGYPKVDVIGMEYIKKWRFDVLGPAEKQNDQVGTLAVELKVD